MNGNELAQLEAEHRGQLLAACREPAREVIGDSAIGCRVSEQACLGSVNSARICSVSRSSSDWMPKMSRSTALALTHADLDDLIGSRTETTPFTTGVMTGASSADPTANGVWVDAMICAFGARRAATGAPTVRMDVQRHEHPIELDRDRRVAKPYEHHTAVSLEPELQPRRDRASGWSDGVHDALQWTTTNRITARVIITGTSPDDTMLHHDVGQGRWRLPRPPGPDDIRRRVRPRGEAAQRGAGLPARPPGSACLHP